MSDSPTLGSVLKQGRELLGLTLRQVEEAIGISNAYLSQLENDKIKMPSAGVLWKLSNLYSIPLEKLLKVAGIIRPADAVMPTVSNMGVLGVPNITTEEEQKLLEYLQFLRWKQNK